MNVESIEHPVLTTSAGEYWRILRPGDYTISTTSRDGTPEQEGSSESDGQTN